MTNKDKVDHSDKFVWELGDLELVSELPKKKKEIKKPKSVK